MTKGQGKRSGGAMQAPGHDRPRHMRDAAAPFFPTNPANSLKIMGEAI